MPSPSPSLASILRADREAREKIRKAKQRAPRFRGANLALQSSSDRVTILAGPRDTGKTTATLWKLDTEIRAHPGARGAIVRKVRADIGTTTLPTWRRVLDIRGGVTAYGGEDPSWFDYPNGARVYLAGLDRDSKLLGAEFDYLAPSQLEEFALSDMEGFVASTSGRAGKTAHPMVIADCNPGPPNHWIRQKYEESLRFTTHRDNPAIFDDDGNVTPGGAERLRSLDGYTGVRYKRLRLGLWVAAEGTVYEFDDAVHLWRGPLPPFVRRFRAIDYGFSNPFTCQWWGMDGDGRLYLYREIYRTQRLVRDHGFEILRLSAGLSRDEWEALRQGKTQSEELAACRAAAARGERIEVTIRDHDAEGGATLDEMGIETTPAVKAKERGIELVELRLRMAGDGRPRLYVCEGALVERDEELRAAGKPTCTQEEFGVYRRPIAKDGKATKEEPIKEHDHGMDPMRYLVMHLDGDLASGPPTYGDVDTSQWRTRREEAWG